MCEVVQEGLQVLSLCLSLLGTLLLTCGLPKVENQEGGREDGVRGQCGEDEKRKE